MKAQTKDRTLCRNLAAEYLGVSSNTLRNYPIPFVQYRYRGYTIYKLADLKAFKEKSIHNPVIEQGGIRVPDEKGDNHNLIVS